MPSADPAPILLDTCALLWTSNNGPLAAEAADELLHANNNGVPIVVSPISAWEIGNLVSKGRLVLEMEPRPWFQRALDAGVRLADMPPHVLIASAFLPASNLTDPADRILAATAREFGYRLMTRDRPLLEYGSRGHFRVLRC
jgi:PIN domain nuclease of toxin-antitoxin system